MGNHGTGPAAVPVNLHFHPSELVTESRLLRLTQALAEAGVFERIEICGIKYNERAVHEDLDSVRHLYRAPIKGASRYVPIHTKLFHFLQWYWIALRRYLPMPITCVNPHTVSTLPVSVLIKWIKGCRLVYEPHEIETETTMQKGLRRLLAKSFERFLIRQCDLVILVHDVYADWYRTAYGDGPFEVVRNLPRLPDQPVPASNYYRETLGIPDDHLVFVTSGSIAEGRSVNIILKAFASLPRDRHVVFMGFGPGVAEVKAYAERHPNIHYLPAVAPQDVHRAVKSADVGISLIENDGLSHYLSFPVRLGDYLAVGLPAIISDFPAMRAVLETHDCGWKAPVSAAGFAEVVASITLAEAKAKGQQALEWTRVYNWQDQQERMLQMYEKLGFPRRPQAASAP